MSNVPLSVEDVPRVLAELQREKFFGRLSLEFNDGHLKLVRKEQTFITEEETPRVRTIFNNR